MKYRIGDLADYFFEPRRGITENTQSDTLDLVEIF
jgi:hypothetical protein